VVEEFDDLDFSAQAAPDGTKLEANAPRADHQQLLSPLRANSSRFVR
jgi:hypothetical protein